MWNCTHFRHPTDEQLRHVDIYIYFSNYYNLQSVHFELEIGGENPDYKLNTEAEVFVLRVRSSRRTKETANKLFKDIDAQEVEDGD